MAQAFASGAGGALGSYTFGGSAVAYAAASAAMEQRAQFVSTFTAEMENGGTVTAAAKATAIGHGGSTSTDEQAAARSGAATAVASAQGLGQLAFRVLGPSDFTIVNSGTVNVAAAASAQDPDNALAQAFAIGAVQSTLFGRGGASYSFDNSGTIVRGRKRRRRQRSHRLGQRSRLSCILKRLACRFSHKQRSYQRRGERIRAGLHRVCPGLWNPRPGFAGL